MSTGGIGIENMSEFDRKLFDEYKRLDAVCRDMFSCQYGVSEYISQMEQVSPQMRRRVPSWDKDYRTLKRLRWLRNQIAHETCSTDCDINDIERLEDFYNRILIQQDPLAVLWRNRQNVPQSAPPKHTATPENLPYSNNRHEEKSSDLYYAALFIASVVVIIKLLAFIMRYFVH